MRDVKRAPLSGHRAERRRHGLRAALAVVEQDADQAQRLGARRADLLLQPRPLARYDERPLVEREDLAEGVVAAHGDHPRRLVHQPLQPRLEGDRLHALQPLGARGETGAGLGSHEGPEHDQGGMGQQRIALVGAQDPIHQTVAVAAAARRDQDERPAGRVRFRHGRAGADLARQIAGEDGLAPHRLGQVEAAERVPYLGQAVHPDLVVEVADQRQDVLPPPLGREQCRLVHHVAQAEDQAGTAGFQGRERLAHLAPEPGGLLVHDEDVRVEDACRVLDDGAAQAERLLDVEMQAERGVFAVAELHHAGHPHEIDAGAEIEAADDGRAGEDQHRQVLVLRHQMMRDRPTPPQVPEPEAVVAVDENARALAPDHAASPPIPGRSLPLSPGQSRRRCANRRTRRCRACRCRSGRPGSSCKWPPRGHCASRGRPARAGTRRRPARW